MSGTARRAATARPRGGVARQHGTDVAPGHRTLMTGGMLGFGSGNRILAAAAEKAREPER
jgi:hypothetical protein